MSDSLYLVFSNPRPGDDDECDRWYREEHMVETIHVLPGLVSAQRFRRDELSAAPSSLPRYLTAYGVENGADAVVGAAIEQYRTRNGAPRPDGRLQLSPTLDIGSVVSGLFRPTSEVVLRSGA